MRATDNPFEVLGVSATADVEEVRHAYRALAKKCHPDQFLDRDEQQAAQGKMIALNLAYEEALRLANARQAAPYHQALPEQDALHLARKLLRQQNPQGALRQLLRSMTRSAAWYCLQGEVLMAMEQYESAHQSYREAVRRDPDNILYRRGALDAAVALRKSKTLLGRLKHLLHQK